jgi:hypothetical protein
MDDEEEEEEEDSIASTEKIVRLGRREKDSSG